MKIHKLYMCFNVIVILTQIPIYAQESFQNWNAIIQSIDTVDGNVTQYRQTDSYLNINTKDAASTSNYDGSILFTSRKVISLNSSKDSIETKESVELYNQDKGPNNFQLDYTGNFLLYNLEYTDYFTFQIFNIKDESLSTSYTYQKEFFIDGIPHQIASSNLDVIAFTYLHGGSKERVYVLERKDDQFNNPIELDDVDLVTDLYITSSGNEIFYNASVTENVLVNGKPSTDYFYYGFSVKREEDGWGKPAKLEIPGVTKAFTAAIGLDGKLLLAKVGDVGLALTRKTEKGWSEPEYINRHYYSAERYQMSENGKVFMIATARQPYPDIKSQKPYEYDIHLYTLKQNGKYESHRVTSQFVTSSGELLTPDGSLLFWQPLVWPSAVKGYMNN